MNKFIPYEKMSKKEQQKINKAKRGTWGELNPVTRKPQNSKAYNRKRAQAWKKDFPDLCSFFFCKVQEYCRRHAVRPHPSEGKSLALKIITSCVTI